MDLYQPLISMMKLIDKSLSLADLAVHLLCASLTATRNPMFLLWSCHNIVLSALIEGSSSDTEAIIFWICVSSSAFNSSALVCSQSFQTLIQPALSFTIWTVLRKTPRRGPRVTRLA